jgi:cytosolic 5'-nucleotidase 3
MNKEEISFKDLPVFERIKNRKNILLMGDSLSDIDMVKGFDCDNVIKIGFLNDEIEKMKEFYLKKYDILITNDSSMDFVNELLKEIG